MLENSQINQKMIESSAHIDMHFHKITSHLNQSASTSIPDQTQELHQYCQVNQLDIPLESIPHVGSNFEYVP